MATNETMRVRRNQGGKKVKKDTAGTHKDTAIAELVVDCRGEQDLGLNPITPRVSDQQGGGIM